MELPQPLGVVVPCWALPWWVWKRCSYVGSDDSYNWPRATAGDFEPVPRICRLILSVYEDDPENPKFAPPGGYGIKPEWVVKRVGYDHTQGCAPPYLIYTDHDHREIVLALRGLNVGSESDYKVLLDNRLGKQMFDGCYVHHGLLKSAVWLINQESETLLEQWRASGCSYKMVFAGHSLGSGVAAIATIIVVNHRERFDLIPRTLIRCYAVAPARSMSLPLAVRYADVIHSVVLQLALPNILIVIERYIDTGKQTAYGSKKAICSRQNISHCGEKILQADIIDGMYDASVKKWPSSMI